LMVLQPAGAGTGLAMRAKPVPARPREILGAGKFL
jgi:hypothetical protein